MDWPIISLSISKDQSTLFSISNENVIKKWSLVSYIKINNDEIKCEKNDENRGIILKINKKISVSSLHMTDEGDFIIVGYRDGSLLVCNLEFQRMINSVDLFEEFDEDQEFKPRKNMAIKNIVSREIVQNNKSFIRIWVSCGDNNIKEWKLKNQVNGQENGRNNRFCK